MPRRSPCLRLLLPVLLAACAGGPARAELYDPGRPSPALQERLVAAEKLYRGKDPGFDAERDEMAQDPVAAFWLTRMFVRDVIFAREGRVETSTSTFTAKQLPDFQASERVDVRRGGAGDPADLVRQAAKIKNPVEARALDQIDALGARAVPCLVQDLLHRTGLSRELGIELLGRIGAPALPGIATTLSAADPKLRRTGVRVLASMTAGPEVLAAARLAAKDSDFGVRGEAMAVLAVGEDADAAIVRAAVDGDGDKFVRRKAAAALALRRERLSASTLIAYLERCKAERDADGERAAQEALAKLAGTSGPRTVDAWKRWLPEWDPAVAVNKAGQR